MVKILTIENYIKAIYFFSFNRQKTFVGTNELAKRLKVKPSSVSSMLVKLKDEGLIEYKKHSGVKLNDKGKKKALKVIRKHRLWETFLYEKLNFSWSEVHEIAEQLEHIQSDLLINRLEQFLNNPKKDPHGDQIPNEKGMLIEKNETLLSSLLVLEKGKLVRVIEDGHDFLNYLQKNNLLLGAKILILEKNNFDHSFKIKINDKQELFISGKSANSLYVEKI